MSKKLAFLVLITLVPVGLRAEKSPETGGADPWDLAVNVYEKPTVPYQGRMQVSRFSDKDSKAREVEIYFLPPDLYRMEFYSLKGDIERVVQSDSLREQVTVMSNGKASHVSSYSRPQQTMTPAQQKELLKKNYKSNVTGSDQVMGRPVWVLVLTPVTEGKPVSEYKIDKRTHMVLESKRSLPQTPYGSLTRFLRYEPNKTFSRDLFLAPLAANNAEQNELVKRSAVDLNAWNGYAALPAGFYLNGGNSLEFEGTPLQQYYYTDGLVQLSVFKTDFPVSLPENGMKSKTPGAPSLTNLAAHDQVVSFRSGKSYYTLIGDMKPDVLNSIGASFK